MVLVRALIFDMDGVLIDSNPWHRRVWAEFCERHGLPLPPDRVEWMYGKRNDEIVDAWFGGQRSAAERLRLGHEKEALFRELLRGRVMDIAVPGLHDLLRRYDSYPAAVASNAEIENLEFVIQGLGLGERFGAVVSGGEVQRPKPDPEVYLVAAQRLGVGPGECLVFEDTAPGVAAARAAGMRAVGLSTTTPDLPGAELVVEDFRSLALEPFLAAALASAPVAEGGQP
jgi:beta-phosphoglucomutase